MIIQFTNLLSFCNTMLFNLLQVVPSSATNEHLSNISEATGALSQASIELAEAAANFGALKVVFGVFLVFTLIIMLAFLWQSFTNTKKVNDIYATTLKVEKIVEQTESKNIGRPQANILIRRLFKSLSHIIKYHILRTRIENHISGNEEQIRIKLTRMLENEYTELVSFLNDFEYNGKPLSTFLDGDDAQLIIDFMMEWVYKKEELFSISQMDQSADILVNGLKLTALRGIA